MSELVPDNLERCPAHPEALVRRVKDTRQPVMNGYPVGVAVVTATHYECSECDRALALCDPRDAAPRREGIFRDHNCSGCQSGALPCRERRDGGRGCSWPRARND